MEFKRENCTFTIPDEPNVKQQLRWLACVSGVEEDERLVRFWNGAKILIQTWESADMPDYKVDLEKVNSRAIRELVSWAGLEVLTFMNALEETPKN